MPLWMAYDQTVRKIKGGIPEAASNSGDACFPCWRHVVTACTGADTGGDTLGLSVLLLMA